eukprot:CAMPEP_0170602576 /NCGR_PEP_ID=MMETSP0224-20130122/18460_1 /TAXON_ID=285029 /ORGANISM="Togula jolla, Strain CCCM 725" /LENGTH=81 /DNA_ID=CAMNT_0010927415 /DNA_START=801 /DNA_END=1044 /DNA_ORIENTATION=+
MADSSTIPATSCAKRTVATFGAAEARKIHQLALGGANVHISPLEHAPTKLNAQSLVLKNRASKCWRLLLVEAAHAPSDRVP